MLVWIFVRGERVGVDIRTSAVKNNRDFTIDMCKHFGLDVHLFLVYLVSK